MIVALGDLMMDIACHAKAPVLRGADCFVQGGVSPGGSAANFAVWAARLGARVGLIAKVGDDLFGHALLEDLEREGVEAGVVKGTEMTGFTTLLIEQGGERTMLAARGATSTLSVTDLDWGLLNRADLLHVTAYSFFEDTPREAARAAMRHVKGRGGLLSLDPSAYGYLRSLGSDAFFELAQDVDILFPNLDEGRALTGEQEPECILRALLAHFPLVALKMGANGAMAADRKTVVHHPGYAVQSVDTTGAGDAFAAAFAVAWLTRHDLAVAVREGNRIAAGVVQTPGARLTAVPPAP
jgi:ribokinase